MSAVFIKGLGAVSPAGWGLNSMRDALAKGEPLPTRPMPRPGASRPLKVRAVAPPVPRPPFLAHPRLRRASPISQFAVGAAVEAVGGDARLLSDGSWRLGIILCVMGGCVNYSRRFYDEALRDPATASPLVFPETVFNAPASHLAAFLGATSMNYTLVGDPGMFLVGLALGARLLREDQVDGCVVVAAEETDWLIADAFSRFERKAILSEGAGALYLSKSRPETAAVQLEAVTEAHSFVRNSSRVQAAAAMRAELPPALATDLLCDGTQRLPKLDTAELRAWADWRGPRLSPKVILGEGLAAASAWQCVAAIDIMRREKSSAAVVSVVGCNQQAIGARFRLV